MTLRGASLISRDHRGSTSRRGAAAAAPRSVPEGENGNGRATPHPPRTSAPNVRHAGCAAPGDFETERRPTGGARAPRRYPSADAPRERPSRPRERDRDRRRRRPHDGPVSQATSRAASGCVPATRRSVPTSFLPPRNGRNATSSPTLAGEAEPAHGRPRRRRRPGFVADSATSRHGRRAQTDPRRRRRRRGRRRNANATGPSRAIVLVVSGR